jgi:RNA polymerase sigma-70 factor (ECF subfamily)
MAKNDSVESADEGERARIAAAERQEKIAKLKLRRSKLTAEEAALLEEVFPEIVADHNDQVMDYLRRKGVEGQDAEDVRQETFLAFHRYILETGFPEDIPPVLYSFTDGRRMNLVRAQERAPYTIASVSSSSMKPKSGDLELALHRQRLARLLFSKLSPEHQAVIMKVIADDLTHTEAAEALGIPEGTLKSRVLAAKRVLRALAEEFVSASQRAPL